MLDKRNHKIAGDCGPPCTIIICADADRPLPQWIHLLLRKEHSNGDTTNYDEKRNWCRTKLLRRSVSGGLQNKYLNLVRKEERKRKEKKLNTK